MWYCIYIQGAEKQRTSSRLDCCAIKPDSSNEISYWKKKYFEAELTAWNVIMNFIPRTHRWISSQVFVISYNMDHGVESVMQGIIKRKAWNNGFVVWTFVKN